MENTVFQLPQGIELTSVEALSQGYSLEKRERFTVITATISAEHMLPVLTRLFETIPAPAFLVLEVPASREMEETLRKADTDPLHTDVYYRDGLQTEEMVSLFRRHAQLLIHDGLCSIGFGSHGKTNEVFVDEYKTVRIMTNEPDRFLYALLGLDIPRKELLKTAWNTLTPETPGSRSLFSDHGKTIFDLVEQLQTEGLYFAEHRAQR